MGYTGLMTHEELVAICDNYSFKDSAEPVKALRAVMELHIPIDKSRHEGKIDLRCRECTDGFEPYPCPTIQAIEKELING